jgi:hypothetical protein
MLFVDIEYPVHPVPKGTIDNAPVSSFITVPYHVFATMLFAAHVPMSTATVLDTVRFGNSMIYGFINIFVADE